MSLGGHGTANMTGNVAPQELAAISTPWTSYQDAENFKNAYLGLLPLLHYTYSAVNPVAVKSLMKALGMPAGDLRKRSQISKARPWQRVCALSLSWASISATATNEADFGGGGLAPSLQNATTSTTYLSRKSPPRLAL